MEGGVSSDVIEESGIGGGNITRLPEECLSHTIALMPPRDACRSEAISVAFRAAAVSDSVWKRLLPHDILDVVSRATDRIEFYSMKDLYFQLCDSILVDGGKMSFWLDRETGAKCFMLSARELFIVWGDTTHYWAWNPHPESRFVEVAELLSVCWLEINGKINTSMLSPRTRYAAYLVFKKTDRAMGLAHPSQEVSVALGADVSKSSVRLHEAEEASARMRFPIHRRPIFPRPILRRPHVVQEHPDGPVEPPADARAHPHDYGEDLPEHEPPEEGEAVVGKPFRRPDGWMEVLLGEFYNEDGDDGEVEMSLKEVKGGQWKSGLVVQGMEIRPKE